MYHKVVDKLIVEVDLANVGPFNLHKEEDYATNTKYDEKRAT